jgi:hypothetical protein
MPTVRRKRPLARVTPSQPLIDAWLQGSDRYERLLAQAAPVKPWDVPGERERREALVRQLREFGKFGSAKGS